MPNVFIDDIAINSKRVFRYLTAAVAITIVIGTIFYHYVEGWGWIDSYYFSVVTLATVGFGDLSPKTNVGKIFTTIYIFWGVGMLAAYFGLMVRRRWQHRYEDHFKDRIEANEVDAKE
jgi:voltage-gated potassium channel